MKKILLLAGAAALLTTNSVLAQDEVFISETTVVTEAVPCNTHYYSTKSDNWFLELGAGINVPFVEREGGKGEQITANYGVGFGKWFSPYFGWRMELNGGSIHWNNAQGMGHAKTANASLDVMWDLFNSLGNVNSKRAFSVVPFLGIGGTFNWDYKHSDNQYTPIQEGHYKRNEWLLPVSAGLQLRFRLCKYVDFFAQARAQFFGDAYNNQVVNRPVDINLSALGGFTFNLGGSQFREFNPCNYLDYINGLNDQVNNLRGTLAATEAALAAANAQLPCPPTTNAAVVVEEEDVVPLLATVRFTIDSDVIANTEKVNVYNIAQWLKDNPEQSVVITGYADKDTGTSDYNMALSQRRAKAVYNMLVNEYGINPSRLSTDAQGSNVQPYNVNNWNRIVIFSAE